MGCAVLAKSLRLKYAYFSYVGHFSDANNKVYLKE